MNGENLVENQNPQDPQADVKDVKEENPNPPEVDPVTKEMQQIMSRVRSNLVRSILGSIDYRAMFDLIGQPEKYDDFHIYTKGWDALIKERQEEYKRKEDESDDAYAARVKELDEKYANERPKSWSAFIDPNKTINTGMMANFWDEFLTLAINVSVTSADVIATTIHDVITNRQFMGVQKQHESFAASLGTIYREIDDIKNYVGMPIKVEPTQTSDQ